jgi:hypothetical protein
VQAGSRPDPRQAGWFDLPMPAWIDEKNLRVVVDRAT